MRPQDEWNQVMEGARRRRLRVALKEVREADNNDRWLGEHKGRSTQPCRGSRPLEQ